MKAVLDERNRVIVRIWTSKQNTQFPGEDVGHVSLETPALYISLWPNSGIKHPFEAREPHYMMNYQEDFDAEGRAPEVIICLYSLNHQKIVAEFSGLKERIINWRLTGNNMLIVDQDKTDSESCSSLAYRLLDRGGLIQKGTSGSIMSPDRLVALIFEHKKWESTIYEPHNFHYDGETPPPPEKSYKCIVS